MNFLNASFFTTAVNPSQYPSDGIPEIALAGRSNVGKSSLINCIINRKNLARTSSSPGKTATINFYDIDGKVRIVDLPGYGYAKVSKGEKERWAKMIETYLSSRENLVQVIQLVDARHEPTKDDITMLDWIRSFGFYPIVVATKIDKIAKTKLDGNLEVIYNSLNLDDNSILLPFSAEKKLFKEDMQEIIKEILGIEDESYENN